jgi:hypothetical protein
LVRIRSSAGVKSAGAIPGVDLPNNFHTAWAHCSRRAPQQYGSFLGYFGRTGDVAGEYLLNDEPTSEDDYWVMPLEAPFIYPQRIDRIIDPINLPPLARAGQASSYEMWAVPSCGSL